MYSYKTFSTSSIFSTYTSIIATAMLVRTIINEFQSMLMQLLPYALQEKIRSWFYKVKEDSQTTLVIEEYINGMSLNEIYEASQLYLEGKISPWNKKLNLKKSPRDKSFSVTVNNGEEILDFFQGIQLTWVIDAAGEKNREDDHHTSQTDRNMPIEVTFPTIHREMILTAYIPHVLNCAKAIKEKNKGIKLYSKSYYNGGESENGWSSFDFLHPSTFDTLAMDPTAKQSIIDDLDRFVRRRDYYKRVGKAWKRGYLLYGPPGTGKSSLIAAMANYLNFHIYDLDLSTLQRSSNLKSYLVSMSNRSILVIEDIDCSFDLNNRETNGHGNHDQIPLSGLLNFIDGLWSSCGDEKIIVFTTNYKDRLDPALLRPGRMDMHIHMSYLTPSAFEILAKNYLGETDNHPLIPRVKELISQVDVTPAEVAEELSKSDDTSIALESLTCFLEAKNRKFDLDLDCMETFPSLDRGLFQT